VLLISIINALFRSATNSSMLHAAFLLVCVTAIRIACLTPFLVRMLPSFFPGHALKKNALSSLVSVAAEKIVPAAASSLKVC
jgi:hypothetical protein